MRKEAFTLILLGDPTSGKATHGGRLARKYGLVNLDMGHMLRSLPRDIDRKYGVSAKIDKGYLAPTAAVRMLMRRRIGAVPAGRGMVLNGWPKMLGEAKLVASMLDKRKQTVLFLYLTIPADEIPRRFGHRKGKKRKDDNELALRNRIRYYRTNIRDVVRFFESRYPHWKESTEGPIPHVFKNIDRDLKSKLEQCNPS